MARSTYYYQIKRIDGPDKYAKIKEIIFTIFEDHKHRYGYRRITLELHNQGYCINHKTVQRLMRELGLFCLVRMKKYKSYKGTIGKISPNRLERNFKAEKPNHKWVTDVTEFALLGQKLYLSPILDLYNGEIVAYNIRERPNFAQTMDMLNKAFSKRPNLKGLIFHSNQGWQYQMKKYQHRLKAKGILQSMSRKGNCLDNAVMENFLGHLKNELLYLKDFPSIDQFKFELIDYLDYYNNRRIKSKLGGRSPVQYRLLAA
ncbi:IS3 family transposase [Dendrosporobacter sp. 1207_IL3150]|uniref:IS3 family transposase n=1 Tax=Dendrosporobacter sp. 1207_IL3150 TaxID=3084054 RepID=UPI003FA5FEFA